MKYVYVVIDEDSKVIDRVYANEQEARDYADRCSRMYDGVHLAIRVEEVM